MARSDRGLDYRFESSCDGFEPVPRIYEGEAIHLQNIHRRERYETRRNCIPVTD